MQRPLEAQVNPVLALALSWPKQLTYPIERWSVPARLSNPQERERFFHALANKCGVRGACRKLGMSHGSVYRYIAQNSDFAAEFDAFCARIPHMLYDEARELMEKAVKQREEERANGVAGDPVLASLQRAEVEVLLRTAGHHNKGNVQVSVDNRQVHVEVNDPERALRIRQLEESRRRALQNSESKQSTS